MKSKELLFRHAVEIARRAGALIANHGEALSVSEKGRTDFVTEIDTAVQALIQRELYALAPEYQFMGEEKSNEEIDFSRPLWILDPVDGTTNLIHHFRHSAVSLAMADEGRAFGGIVLLPFSGELFTAFAGKGAFLNGAPISASGAARLADSLISVGTNPGSRESADAAFARARRVYDRCHDIRRIGSAAIEICYVAAGRLDGYFEHDLKPWDYAAAELILREAGGTLTDFSGNPPRCGSRADIVATNGKIHEELLSVLSL